MPRVRLGFLSSSADSRRIPVFSPVLTEADADAVRNAVSRGWLSGTSPVVGEFERGFADFCGTPGAAAVNSGTSALELALVALNIRPGDEVVCPALTIMSCARAILRVGARPVLVDVDPHTWVLDAKTVAERVTKRTRAIMTVHLFGQPVDVPELRRLVPDVAVVEDAAQALGSQVRVGAEWARCGSLGDVSAFSFYANKTLTTGEGGIVTSQRLGAVERARRAASLFFGNSDQRFCHIEVGHSYRMSGLQAALGFSQLMRIERLIEAKKRLRERYAVALADTPRLTFASRTPNTRAVPWMIAVTFDDMDARQARCELDRRGIETRPFFTGLHQQPALRGLVSPQPLPNTERLARSGLYLPSGSDLTDTDIERVADAVRAVASSSSTARRTAVQRPFTHGYASVYDALYRDKPYTQEATAALRAFSAFGDHRPEHILDLGCGTGRHAEELARQGALVTGVDRSPDMLATAIRRRASTTVNFVQSDITALSLPEVYDAATMLFNVLGYLTTDPALGSALSAIHRHLRTGAILVADFWNADAVRHEPPGKRTARFATEDGTRIRRAKPTLNEPQDLVEIEYSIETDDRRQLFTDTHVVRYFSAAGLTRAFQAGGFEVLRIGAWPSFENEPNMDSYSCCLIARAG